MAIMILEELELLRREMQVGKYRLFMQPEPSMKLDIESAPTFRRCAQERENFELWSRELLMTPVEKIWENAQILHNGRCFTGTARKN